ncbi:MAG TPA: hypothetical protein VLU98_03930 [Methanomicrobiales archaeon]|nr:hypothetical protein [Methanomicrobiales archaeon]
MERTLFRVLAVLAAVSLVFIAVFSLTVFMELAYRATISSTYEYRVSITTDTTLENATFYLPIPARGPAASAVLEGIGAGDLKGLPPGWNISLIGTEKITMLEVTAREIAPSPVGVPYLLSVNEQAKRPVDTLNAGTGDLVLLPAARRTPVACGNMDSEAGADMLCELYHGTAYADFTAAKNEHLSIFTLITGRNTWDVFGPSYNEYQDGLQVSYEGRERGWKMGDGILITGMGDYGIDFWLQHPDTTGPGGGRPRQYALGPMMVRG